VTSAHRPQPTFATARLTLRPVSETDLAELHGLWNDSLVRRYLFDDRPVTRALANSVLQRQLVNATAGLGLWMVQSRSQGHTLGCVGLYPVTFAAVHEPALEGLLEPLAALAPSHWAKGFAREALSALLDYGFGQLDQATIAGVVDAPNAASQRMLEALGFERFSETPGERYRQFNYLQARDAWRSRPD